MGLYIFITEEERVAKRKVSDEEVNESFQEALKFDSSLLIEEKILKVKKFLFKTVTKKVYQVFHDHPASDCSAYQARYQMSASGEKRIVMAYLHGIVNGCSNYLYQNKGTWKD